MKHLNNDDIRDIAINIVDEMVLIGLIPNCTDTNDDSEFIVQDLINKTIIDILNKKHPHLIEKEELEYCEVGEHYVEKEEHWNFISKYSLFGDCMDCVDEETVKLNSLNI